MTAKAKPTGKSSAIKPKTATSKTQSRPKPTPKGRKPNGGKTRLAQELKREAFVNHFIANSGNASQAAISAGYSPKCAHAIACNIMKRPEIVAAISIRAGELMGKYRLTSDLAARSIVQELSFDPARLYHTNGQLKAVTELDLDTRMALTSIDIDITHYKDGPTVETRKYKWATRDGARNALMKHLGMFIADNAQKNDANMQAAAAAAAAAATAATETVAKILDFAAIRARVERNAAAAG